MYFKTSLLWSYSFLTQLGDDLEYLLAMMKQLQDFYTKQKEGRWGILCPQVGMICITKFKLDNQWYRAQIVGKRFYQYFPNVSLENC